MTTKTWVFLFLMLTALTGLALYATGTVPRVYINEASLPGKTELMQRGEYLANISGCRFCHTNRANGGANFAGGRRLETPYGSFFTPNITPDKVNGIGKWRLEDFVRALRHGMSPLGTHYFPIFPYASYTRMSTEDIASIFTYLKTIEPARQFNPPHKTKWYVWRASMRIWKRRYLKTGELVSDPLETAAWNRGNYLAHAVAHCDECHTPRKHFWVKDQSVGFSGNSIGLDGVPAPNITPSQRNGIYKWTETELVEFFKTGKLPRHGRTGAQMSEVIATGLNRLTEQDAQALATFIGSLPAVD